MSHGDWVPSREQDFKDFSEKWKIMLSDSAKIAAYGWDAAECAEVVNKITEFLTARAEYARVNSTENRVAKDEAKETAISAIRQFANAAVRFNRKIPDSEKLHLGVYVNDHTHTLNPVPTSQPSVTVENTVNHFEHQIRAGELKQHGVVRPDDAYGIRYGWQVGGEKPAAGADLPKTKFSRKTTITVLHTEGEKGKIVYYAACYENRRGQTGPWSPIVEGVIG